MGLLTWFVGGLGWGWCGRLRWCFGGSLDLVLFGCGGRFSCLSRCV